MSRKKVFLGILAVAIFAGFYTAGQLIRGVTLPAKNNAAITSRTSDEGEWARVARAIDGDTIELQNGERVRYIGMDAPEAVDLQKPVQCFGPEATERNRELVLGKSVWLAKDISEHDKYGRFLRYVWAGDVLVNLELVKEGYALALAVPPDIKYREDIDAAEREAKTASAGLWGGCR